MAGLTRAALTEVLTRQLLLENSDLGVNALRVRACDLKCTSGYCSSSYCLQALKLTAYIFSLVVLLRTMACRALSIVASMCFAMPQPSSVLSCHISLSNFCPFCLMYCPMYRLM